MVAHEAFHALRTIRTKKDTFVIMKLDKNKAYDKVNLVFLEAILRKIGFCDIWVNWIMQCISTISFSNLVNGERRIQFNSKRGLENMTNCYHILFCWWLTSYYRSFNKQKGGAS